jgi:predicted phosphodiesterase
VYSGRVRRFGLVGDVHCEDGFLHAALAHLTREGVDAILAVGDVVDGRGDADRCVELLTAYKVAAVAGNHERWMLAGEMRDLPHATLLDDLLPRTRDYFASLSRTRTLDTIAGRLLLCHGLGEDDMATVKPDDYGYALEANTSLQRLVARGGFSLVACGHSHERMVRRFGQTTIINAGTLHYADMPGFALVDLATSVVQFFDVADDGHVMTSEAQAIP